MRVIGQIPICWDPDRDAAIQRAHDQFRWFGGGWAVNSDLPTTAGFDGATQFVRPEDVAESIPCGPDLDAIVDSVRNTGKPDSPTSRWCRSADESQDLFLKEAAGSLLEQAPKRIALKGETCHRGKGIYDDESADEPKRAVPGRPTRAGRAAWRRGRTRRTSPTRTTSPPPDGYWVSRPCRLRR